MKTKSYLNNIPYNHDYSSSHMPAKRESETVACERLEPVWLLSAMSRARRLYDCKYGSPQKWMRERTYSGI